MVSSCGCASADFKLRLTSLSLSSNSGHIGDANNIFRHVPKLNILSNSYQPPGNKF